MNRVRGWIAARALLSVGLALVVGIATGALAINRVTAPRLLHGMASSAEGAISVEADGWTYGISQDLFWTDAANTIHENGRPDCLPPSSTSIPVTFAAIDVAVESIGWREVIWVDCRGVAVDGAAAGLRP